MTPFQSRKSDSHSDYAWYQSFHDGFQNYSDTDYKLRARAVRRIPIE